MNQYKLLTPGPLTTTETVKQEMLVDHCTWDDDYKIITQQIREKLLEIGHVNPKEYTAVLMQGSGSFGVEAVLHTAISKQDKILICTNGAYGQRMADMAIRLGLNTVLYEESYTSVVSPETVEAYIKKDPEITHVAMVHCETTSGILNDAAKVGEICEKYGLIYILDAMSSFGGLDIPVSDWNVDYLVSSANKCIQGVPGFSFVLAGREKLLKCEGNSTSLSLDLFDQWKTMDCDGKWRFTSPTHVVLAFAKALEELEAEGGVAAREKRYRENHRLLVDRMEALGFKAYIEDEIQSPIITSFLYPKTGSFSFEEMYHFVKAGGYAIYPGKLTEQDTFRIGNIGEIYTEDIERLTEIFRQYLAEKAA